MSSLAQGTFRVHFDQSSYRVSPDGSVAIGVLIDPVPLSGLFSYGMKVVFDDAFARVESASAISLPPPLDYNGVQGPGADRLVGSGFAAVKGTVNFELSPGQAYSGALLATFNVKNLVGAAGQSYPLSLELYRTLGPTESVFVTGAGETLDGQLAFGTTTIDVVPEPRAWFLVLLVIAGSCGKVATVVGADRSAAAKRTLSYSTET
ncbi:MAG: hypothetical protein U1G07_16040 [Verrucomicrobiota bacterium]